MKSDNELLLEKSSTVPTLVKTPWGLLPGRGVPGKNLVLTAWGLLPGKHHPPPKKEK